MTTRPADGNCPPNIEDIPLKRKELTAEERNALFFERHEIALEQERAVESNFYFFGNCTENAVLSVSRKEVGGHGRRTELTLSTPGHEWFLHEDWTDNLHDWLGKVIAARVGAKAKRAKRIAEYQKQEVAKSAKNTVRVG